MERPKALPGVAREPPTENVTDVRRPAMRPVSDFQLAVSGGGLERREKTYPTY
jgi:hypothetical protein